MIIAIAIGLLVFVPEALRDRADGITPFDRVASSEAPGHARRARDARR